MEGREKMQCQRGPRNKGVNVEILACSIEFMGEKSFWMWGK